MKVTKKMKRFAALLIAAVVMLSGVPLPSVQAAGDAKGVNTLTFTVKDKEGHPVEGVELDIYDRGGRTYTNLESKMGGVVRWNIPSYFDTYNGQVLEIKPINEEEEIGSITFKVKFDGFYTVIDTINGEPAENVKNLELTVNKKGGAVEDKPEITSVSLNKSSLENAGGQVYFSIYGKKLKNNVTVEVLKDGSVTQDVKVVQMENQETWNEYWITLPKNEAETEVQYTLRAKLVGDPATVKEKTVTVKGTGLVANPEITQVSVNKTSLESAGGVVQFSVKGKKLKDKVEVEVLKNGVAAGEVKIQQMENQETWNEYWITLPKNEETTAIEYTLRAKVTGDEASAKEVKVTVKEAEKPEVNKEALKQKITDAKAIKNENYTEASWNALQAAITAAEAVRDNADATQDDVDAQVTALETAINALEEKEPEKPEEVNKDELKKAIDDAKAIKNENYTEASWNALQAAIAAAEAVRDDADATQDAVDAQVTALKKAVDGLKENSEKPNPEKPNTEKPNTNKPNPNKPNTNKPNANKPNADKNENAAPKTGDSAPFVPCMAGMICAAAVAGMALKKRKSFE